MSFVKLNVDASRSFDGSAGCGGLIRDSNGKWIRGFSKFVGNCSVLKAELWAVFEGLKMIVDLQLNRVEINTDAKAVIEDLNKVKIKNSGCSSLESQIIRLLEKIPNSELSFSYRESNECANALALKDRHMQHGIEFFHDMSTFIRDSFIKDLTGVLGSSFDPV